MCLYSSFSVLCQRILICAALTLSGPPGRAQGSSFSPAREDSALLAGLYDGYQHQYKEELGRLTSPYKKDYEALYADRWKNIKEKFHNREIYTSAFAGDYLNALAANIVRANPVLGEHPFRCYFSRSCVPNAAYIGEGIILFDMGLFYQLHNESEAAFILCHEIAHYILHHQENSMTGYVSTINSPEVQARLRKIKGSEYNRNAQLENLVKGLSFDSRRHSRDHEAQADSMGVELLRHTGFDLHGVLTTLELLDGIDRSDFDMEGALRRTFDAPDYPFQQRWLRRETSLFGGHVGTEEAAMADSLKTHPSCPLRIRLLAPTVNAARAGLPYIVDSVKFAAVKELCRYEVIEYAFVSGAYTESLFLSLQLLKARPGDEYAVGNTGRLLNGLYAAQKAHRLGKVADLPSPDQPSNYHLLLELAEGYKREASAAGIATGIATAILSRGHTVAYFNGVTKIEITDMVMMEFDPKFKVTGATIYDKRDYTAPLPYNSADMSSQHYLARGLNYLGAFGYEFTTREPDNFNFNVCYSDYERSSEYHGQTFNTIRYNGSKLSTDKIELKSKASMMRILPAKGGSVMILEYFKKDKRLDFLLEKLG
jgi:Zn-dependent protease with chaperone function